MKGSAVVQSLKSWVSKLHPQLPLSPKESSRLLTALTTSFRRHLDEVHPPVAREDAKSEFIREGVARNTKHALHSSAMLADNHLASVLTNPLLAKGNRGVDKASQDFANVKVELQKNPSKDPILVLEEYQAKGAATIPIAALCLQTFSDSLQGLSQAARDKKIRDVQPGKRTLLWLWESERYRSAAFADSIAFIRHLAKFAISEGHEELLWEWLAQDVGHTDKSEKVEQWKRQNLLTKLQYHKYRWKGRFLATMILAKLPPPGENASADAALEVFIRAIGVRSASQDERNGHMRWLPVGPAGAQLQKELTSAVENAYPRTDPKLYDQLIDLVPEFTGQIDFTRAVLHLYHPRHPNAMPAYKLFERCLSPEPPQDMQSRTYRRMITNPNKDTDKGHWVWVMTHAAVLLEMDGLRAESQWLENKFTELAPSLARWTEINKRKIIKAMRPQVALQGSDEPAVAARVPFPTFV